MYSYLVTSLVEMLLCSRCVKLNIIRIYHFPVWTILSQLGMWQKAVLWLVKRGSTSNLRKTVYCKGLHQTFKVNHVQWYEKFYIDPHICGCLLNMLLHGTCQNESDQTIWLDRTAVALQFSHAPLGGDISIVKCASGVQDHTEWERQFSEATRRHQPPFKSGPIKPDAGLKCHGRISNCQHINLLTYRALLPWGLHWTLLIKNTSGLLEIWECGGGKERSLCKQTGAP